jgi:hypothetical protein
VGLFTEGDAMTKSTTRSVFCGALFLGAVAAGCNPGASEETGPPPFGSAGNNGAAGFDGIGGTAGFDGAGAACGPTDVNGKNSGGGAIAFPGMASGFAPRVGATHTQAEAPPAISGGTLLILADGKTAVAADPDRDRVYVVDLSKRVVTSTIALQHGDEPGRLIADGSGHVHVALRRGGALVSISPTTGTIVSRRAVCAAPRGVAYEAAKDLLHVACTDGQLISLPAAGGDAVRTLQLDNDLRDVVVEGAKLRVTRFRSAELLTIESDGTRSDRMVPPAFRSMNTRSGQMFTASVAWRAMAMPDGGVAILHQRGVDDPIMPTAGGYGGFSACDAIVQTAVTTVVAGQTPKSGPAIAGMPVAVDMAISANGSRVAIISAGNATNSETEGGPARLPRVFVTDMANATDGITGCSSDGMHAPCLPFAFGVFPTSPPEISGTAGASGSAGSDAMSSDAAGAGGTSSGTAGASGTSSGTAGSNGASEPPGGANNPATPSPLPGSCPSMPTDPLVPEVVGEPIAVAFAGDGRVVVQSREPALLELANGSPIVLSTESHLDTGHALFHANAGAFVACASCHAEGNEDGRIWNFSCEGARRTQSLQTGLAGTEPFHWGGDEKNFTQLVQDVFQGRMSGPEMKSDQVAATLQWIDAQPKLPKSLTTNPAAVARGKALFNDPARAGCVSCHSGERFTNNLTVDVGTKGAFQVPSLVGIGSRGPYMHNGCAATLRDRFTNACGGGDKHGLTSTLSSGQIDDMVAFLNTI